LAEIILAIEHLHNHGILHRDLKPENILLGVDGHVCLTDFGLAKDFSVSDNGSFLNSDKASASASSNTTATDNDNGDEQRARTICGTGEYMAPEMIARQGYGRAADYWSLGCIAYEMLSGRPPFESRQGAKALFIKIMTEKIKMPTGSSAAACKLMKGLLNRNVQARLGAAKSTMFEVGGVAGLKKVDFFSAIDWDKLVFKQIEPPAVFSIDHDCDVQHFHDEFTQMPLPRSVIDMSMESFQPRRVESEAFRGFSFIHDDFVLPERGIDEEQSYWESIEEDGESVSECASSKMGDEVESLQSPPPSTSKRPPRKRKKKPADQSGSVLSATPAGMANNNPITSVSNTPEPSECGDIPDQLDSLRIGDRSSEKLEDGNDHPVLGVVKPTAPVLSDARIAAPLKPTEEETWQVAKKEVVPKQKQKNSLTQFANTRAQSPWSTSNQPNRVVTNANGSKPGYVAKRHESGPPVQSPSVPSRSGWNQGVLGVVQRPVPSPQQKFQANNSTRAAPSSDWRNHSMANRVGNAVDRSPQQPLRPGVPANAVIEPTGSPIVWPSLSKSSPVAPASGQKTDIPPVAPIDTTKSPVASGAWASRASKS
jgi:serine/threonine protein kinase